MAIGRLRTRTDQHAIESEADQLRTHEDDGPNRPRKPLHLIHIGSPENDFAEAGRSFVLGAQRSVCFGRTLADSIEADEDTGALRIGIPVPWVSGAHAELSVFGSGTSRGFRLTDLQSRNGTFVEGRRVESFSRVKPGDVFEVGRSFWMVRPASGRQPKKPQRLDPDATASPRLLSCFRSLERLAQSQVPIIVSAETGAGRAHVAHTVHELSGRDGPFLRVNVAASPICTEVFRQVQNGTLYLDEIGELSRDSQAQLSAVLGMRTAEPGATPLGVRLIAGTTRELRRMVNDGQFRPDLYARISGYEARLPALRERREDLGLLVKRFARTPTDEPVPVTSKAFRMLMGHSWPFNIRELEHTIAAAIAPDEEGYRVTEQRVRAVMWRLHKNTSPRKLQTLREQLVSCLVEHAGDTDAVARVLVCDASVLSSWLTRFDLRPREYAAIR